MVMITAAIIPNISMRNANAPAIRNGGDIGLLNGASISDLSAANAVLNRR